MKYEYLIKQSRIPEHADALLKQIESVIVIQVTQSLIYDSNSKLNLVPEKGQFLDYKF